MKKTQNLYYFMLFICVLSLIIIAVGHTVITTDSNQIEEVQTPIINRRMDLLIGEDQIIIEKEVAVSVENANEDIPEIVEYEEAVEEPDIYYYDQPLDYNFNIMMPSGYTSEELYRSLGGIRNGMESSIEAIIAAEDIYGINALYLLAMLGLESGWGTVESGTNNIAGWKGAPDGSWSNYNSRYECIMDVSHGLVNDFVPDVGPYIYNIASRYTPDEGYIDKLLCIMYELKSNIY